MAYAHAIDDDPFDAGLRIEPKITDAEFHLFVLEEGFLDERIHGIVRRQDIALPGIRIAESGELRRLTVIHADQVKTFLALQQDLLDLTVDPRQAGNGSRFGDNERIRLLRCDQRNLPSLMDEQRKIARLRI